MLVPIEQKMLPARRRPCAERLTHYLDNCSRHMSGATEVYLSEDKMIRLTQPPSHRIWRPVASPCFRQSKKN
jgi:hypothetical protein